MTKHSKNNTASSIFSYAEYKKLDYGTRSAGDIIVPGMPISDIVEQEKRQRLANKGIEKLKIRKNRVLTTPRLDPMTGYKRVNHTTKQTRKQQSKYTQRVMEGEETDGLSFLEEDSGQQDWSMGWSRRSLGRLEEVIEIRLRKQDGSAFR